MLSASSGGRKAKASSGRYDEVADLARTFDSGRDCGGLSRRSLRSVRRTTGKPSGVRSAPARWQSAGDHLLRARAWQPVPHARPPRSEIAKLVEPRTASDAKDGVVGNRLIINGRCDALGTLAEAKAADA